VWEGTDAIVSSPGISLGPHLTRDQVRESFARGETVVWVILQMAQMIAQQQTVAADRPGTC